MALKFRRGTTAQKSGSLAFGEPYVNTTLGTLQIGLESGDATLSAIGTGSNLQVNNITASNLHLTGNANIDGNLTLGGTITIGDNSSDTVNVVASLSSSLIPSITNTFDLGDITHFWRDLYISTGSIKIVDGSGNIVNTLTNANIVTTSSLASGSINLTNSLPAGTVSSSAQIVSILNPLNTFSSSLETKNSTLGSYTASLETKNSTLGTYTASLETKNSTLESYTASLETKNSTLASYTSSLETKNSALASTTASLLSSQTNLNTYTSSLNNAIELTGSTVSFLGNIVVYGTQSVINSENVQISDNILYLSPTASVDNDLGIVGHYNDGTYRHAGIFMDASDGHTWKVFNGLQTETGAQIDINGTGFTLADFKAGVFTGTSFNGTINATNGVVSGSSQITAGSTTNFATDVKTQLNSNTVVSGSSQVSYVGLSNIPAGIVSGSSQITYASISSIPAGIVSGSSQITLSSTTGYGSVLNQAVLTSSSPTFAGLTINGAITATGDITAYYTSDKRHKSNIQIIPEALTKVRALNGVTWEWNDDVNEVTKSTPKTGLIAQDVQLVLPEVVKEREDGFLSLDYSKMVGLLVEAIKEQQTQIHSLTLEIEKLKESKGL